MRNGASASRLGMYACVGVGVCGCGCVGACAVCETVLGTVL